MNQIINGKREGYWEDYYSNGNLCYKGYYKKGHYKNDIEDGYWEEYYFNGDLKIQEICL